MAKQSTKSEKNKSPGALFIPAGILLGFGWGLLTSNVAAGMFLGLGSGFLVWALYEIFRKR